MGVKYLKFKLIVHIIIIRVRIIVQGNFFISVHVSEPISMFKKIIPTNEKRTILYPHIKELAGPTDPSSVVPKERANFINIPTAINAINTGFAIFASLSCKVLNI
jgi:hypothetical protein